VDRRSGSTSTASTHGQRTETSRWREGAAAKDGVGVGLWHEQASKRTCWRDARAAYEQQHVWILDEGIVPDLKEDQDEHACDPLFVKGRARDVSDQKKSMTMRRVGRR